MKHYLFPLITIICSIFMTSCGSDSPIFNMDDVEKSDLTTPLFLAYDNTLDKNEKLIWAFNETEAVKGTITVVDNGVLRFKSVLFYNTWSYSNKRLTLGQDEGMQYYDLKKVSVLGYDAIAFADGTKIIYTCTPSTNWSINGSRVEENWLTHGLTRAKFWDAFRQSNAEKTEVDVYLTK